MTTVESSFLHPDAIADLRQSVAGAVVLPSDPEYEAVSAIYGSVYGVVSAPALVLRPADGDDVGVAVAFARSHGLELSVRSGGHSGSGFSTNIGGLVIDLRALNDVSVIDPVEGIVRIGAGATWGQVAATLGGEQLALSSGDTVSVGVGGLTLGGGIGWMVRKYGLALDSLVGATVVTAGSEQLRVSATEHADLFWAIRGGGGNFGVITDFTFQAHHLTRVFAGSLLYGKADLAELLAGWRDVMRDAPEELNTTFLAMPEFPGMPGGVQILVCYAGDDSEAADAAFAPLRALPGLTGDAITAQPYADVLEEAHPPEGMTFVGHNAFAREMSDEMIGALSGMYGELGGSVLMIRSLVGAFNRVPNDATAFGFRDSEALVISVAFLPPDAPAEASDRVHALWGNLAPYLQGIYAGFSNAPAGEDPALLYSPTTLARLAEIKRTYDPENLFRRNHNISPALAT
ncbi:FAD-binding oxidoreductase [Mycetocola zhadangensis]|uniref:FAD-binding oxidoreductase n=1 Tax=Mycetocola zhadangensis TaxID=1164595 RepID=A0A3L7J0L3_9MICO|nr:FAD-binding oxidoreductase [Mycetocola zhadangensis]RLQ83993.1 FAD-binding oxidoreductase [Mycetocola zhadangensis]GGE97034.1 FAD-linked oxidase [Mycetocola zhadangensis]